MTVKFQKEKGVTLLEMLLVMVIVASVMVMIIGFIQQKTDEFRRDKAAMQMQMILNAGLAFYINSNLTSPQNQPVWPGDASGTHVGDGVADLIAGKYLPDNPAAPGTMNNPWGQPYAAQPVTGNTALFQVSTTIPGTNTGDVDAEIIAGRLPLATCSTVSKMAGCTSGATTASVTAQVPIPGQNLNNARAVNFASVYSTNGCVPKPNCPLGMQPKIYVVPVSVSGTNDNSGLVTSGAPYNIYPISSFTGFAIDLGSSSASTSGNDCTLPTPTPGVACKWDQTGGTAPSGAAGYWRVCLSITTEKTAVPLSNVMGSVLAITKCVPVNENPGTQLGVF